MNAQRSVLVGSAFALVLVSVAALTPACFKDNPCGAGLVESETSGNCVAPPPPPAPAPDASSDGGEDGGDGGTPAVSNIGKTCASAADCAPDAPQCGAPQLPYCTQINCKEGEVNAGACPAGFTCQEFPGYPSFCFKQ